MGKKLASLMVLLILAPSLWALSWSAGGSIAVHDSSIYENEVEVMAKGSVEDFSFGLLLGGDDYLSFDTKWDHEGGKTFRATLGTSLDGYFTRGGLWTLYADCGQDLRAGWFSFRYRAGIQAGVSWSDHASDFSPFSLSPYAFWAFGIDTDVFMIEAYGASMRLCEHTFQAPPVLGVYAEWNIDGHNTVEIDSFMKLADYMDGPDLVVTDMALRLSYVWRGGEA